VTEPIVAEELALLESVAEGLARAPRRGPPSDAAMVEELEHVREQLLRGRVDDFERAALAQRWNVLTALRRQLDESRSAPRVDPSSPYFAHLRLREGERERDLCLGKATFLEDDVRIVDWRHAPIARLYYRYQQGEEYEEEIGGRTLAGVVVARRAVAIQRGALGRIDAPEGSFVPDGARPGEWRRIERPAPRLAGGEGVALRVHAPGEGEGRRLGSDPSGAPRRADKHLPDIASLIDPEQFALIARPSAGFVAIRGSAGSGKTTVALHRIAYLAYEDPTVDSARTLFLAFSPALRDYVSHVLPALGVERVQVRTFREWAAEQRQRLFPRLPASTREDAPAAVQRLKLHPALMLALERHVELCPGPSSAARAIDDWLSVLSNRELLALALADRGGGGFGPRQLESAVAWSRRRAEDLLAWLEGDRDADAELDPEDDALLLRAWQLRVGPLPGEGGDPLRYRHVAVDEVQDFAPVEVRVLLDCLDERRSLTLAGDAQQRIAASGGFSSWSAFFQDLGVEGTEVETLQVSYRSSREITDFALALLGDARDDTPVVATRSGPPVELFEFTDAGASVAFLAEALARLARDEPLASVAVLAPSPAASDLYASGLERGGVPRVHRVREQDFRFSPGVEVTEIQQVKGLEFDYVVLVEASDAHFGSDEASRRLLHVAATRAVHQLWVTSVGPIAKVMREAAHRGGTEP
jgi:DNA helicase-2/ATP-dependent DNA helicase PcrA